MELQSKKQKLFIVACKKLDRLGRTQRKIFTAAELVDALKDVDALPVSKLKQQILTHLEATQ